MFKLKSILSVLILMTYFLSLGHSLVPHHKHQEGKQEHHHHNYISNENHSHKHVAHGNHFDEGLIDYIACLFGDHQHSENSCELLEELIVQKSAKTHKLIPDLTFKLLNFPQRNLHLLKVKLITTNEKLIHFSFTSNISKRGPPQH